MSKLENSLLAPGKTRRDFLKQGGSAIAAFSALGLAACGSGSSASKSGTVAIGMTSDLFPSFTKKVQRVTSSFSRI